MIDELESALVELLHRPRSEALWNELLERVARYFRVEVAGLENVPRQGPALLMPNHSGYAGADALVLSHVVRRDTGRAPRILAHRAFFEWFRLVRLVSESFGLREAGFKEGLELLTGGELLLVFPEAESGNFKPSSERYHLRRFHTGVLRLALASGAPVIPTLVVGAEESHLNLGTIDLSRFSKNLKLPVPLNLMPLPAKWQVRFLPALDLSPYRDFDVNNRFEMDEACTKIRLQLEAELQKAASCRKYVYFDAG